MKNLTLEELELWCASTGEPPRRAMQLWRWLYGGMRPGTYMRQLEDADGDAQSFSAVFKAKLAAAASLSGGLTLQHVAAAQDGTLKLVMAVHPGEGGSDIGSVETVLIPMVDRRRGQHRYTVCVSSQVGCAMACQFCNTGRAGLAGNLSTAQIVEQVVEALRYLRSVGDTSHVGNVVFMGMGEPLANAAAVTAACRVLTQPMGLAFSRSRVLLSTVGLVPEMRAFRAARVARLAVSLHATTDESRSVLVPVNRRYPLPVLTSAMADMFPRGVTKSDDFVVVQYVMLKGINDSLEDAERLLALLEGVHCMVNLIVFNPHDGAAFERSEPDIVAAFGARLRAGGRVATVRASRGDDQMAACGQLGGPKSMALMGGN